MSIKTIKKSITFISPFAYPLLSKDCAGSTGGAERQFFLFGRELSKRGWRVSFITARPNYGSVSSDHGFSVYHADFSYLGGSNIRILPCWVSLWRAMKKANSNYYVLKVPGHLLAPMSIFCRLYSRRLVFWAQMTFDANPEERTLNNIAGSLQDWGVRRADIVISQSSDQRSGFKKNYNIKSIVVPSICEKLSFPNSVESKINTVDNKSDLLWVGNSLKKKRQEVVFELAKLLPHRTFAIAMNKSDDVRFAEAAKEAEKLSNVNFLGAVPPVEMESWFQKAKLFLNTSIREGFPNTFLQAWMNGVPVVSLDIDPDKIIEKNRLGYVVNREGNIAGHSDFENLAQETVDYVEKLLNDADIKQEMGKRAVLYVNQNHSPSLVIPGLVDALAPNQNDVSNENCKKNLC